MIVQARQFKSIPSLKRYIHKLRGQGLADRHYDLPLPSTAEKWLNSRAIPTAEHMAKAFMLILTPVEGYPYGGYDLAEMVANVLLKRHEAYNDWACGIQSGHSVCLFFKPWGTSFDGKRVWFRPTPKDMNFIRSLDAAYKTKRIYLNIGRER